MSSTQAYIIGGAPRVGKTLAAKNILRRHTDPIAWVSTDAMRDGLRNVVTPKSHPSLFRVGMNQFGTEAATAQMVENPESIIPYHVAEADDIWNAIVGILDCNDNNHIKSLIEGTAVMPSKLAQLPSRYRKIMLVNLEDQTEVLLNYSAANRHDWLNQYDTAFIKAFAHYLYVLNHYFENEAKVHNIEIAYIRSHYFEGDIANVNRRLTEG